MLFTPSPSSQGQNARLHAETPCPGESHKSAPKKAAKAAARQGESHMIDVTFATWAMVLFLAGSGFLVWVLKP